MRIDAHQHFWQYDPAEYGWIGAGMEVLRRDFLPTDLQPHLRAHDLAGSVAVQARQSEAETRWLLGLADAHPAVRGVVGWVDLCADDVAARLATLAHPRLCGMRHILQDEPDDAFMLRPAFRRGLGALRDVGLRYDMLVFPRHLEHLLALLPDLGDLPLVVDHLAKPPIRSGEVAGWADGMRRVAEHHNVYCKVSGMVTEADWHDLRDESFTAYLDVVFEAFGAERLMFGSDWPVCLLAAPYDRVYRLLVDYLDGRTSAERERVLGGTAAHFYGLGSTPS